MSMAGKAVHEIVSFWRRQRRNWRIVVTRMMFNRFVSRLTVDYANIYVRELGASPIQLGSANSLAGLAVTLFAIPIGWMHDRYSLKKLFSFGCGLVAIASLFYALASNWLMIIPAIVLAHVAMRFHCVTICDVCLESGDRSTGRALCEGIGSTPSFIAPTIAAVLITFFGGTESITVEGVRPLYWIQFVARCVLFLFVATQMTEVVRTMVSRTKSSFMGDFRDVFERGTALKRWLAFSTVGTFTTFMMAPFRYPFAHEIKGAEQFIIGGMATASLVAEVLFSIFLGRLADRIGRKKVFYILTPLSCASNLVLVFAPTPEFLILSGILLGFRMIVGIVVTSTITPELVPIDCIGRWRGILGLLGGLVSIAAPIVGGIVWESLGPAYVFLIPTTVELFVRLPLMTTIPETLKPRQ